MDARRNLRPLGRTGLLVSPVGLGCWQFSKRKNMIGRYWPLLADGNIHNIVSLALEGGINWFDTAEIYGGGESERNLSVALQSAGIEPGQVIIATKWWPLFRFASNIKNSFPERIKALAPFPVDLYQIHQPAGFSDIRSEMHAMRQLYDNQLIKSIGVSNFSAAQMEKAWKFLDSKGIPLASNQVRYNLLDRRIETDGTLETAKQLGITIIAYSPLAQGLLTGKFHDNPELLQNIGYRRYSPLFRDTQLLRSLPVIMLLKQLADKYNVTPSQISLNWLIRFNGTTVTAIPGATKEQHVTDNAGAMTFRLSDEDMSALDKVSSPFK
jgi:aryl-alcohol dehydrogenase-like predicted oxidoreductase